jgi:hypothetical protein
MTLGATDWMGLEAKYKSYVPNAWATLHKKNAPAENLQTDLANSALRRLAWRHAIPARRAIKLCEI